MGPHTCGWTQIHADKILFLLLVVCRAAAQDPHLAAIKSTAARIRALPQPELRDGERGATPLHTQLKHRLRDWVESRLADQGKDLAEKSFRTAGHPGPRADAGARLG